MSIILDKVTHVFEADTSMALYALDNVSIVIPDGQFIGLIGHTGSGKSTLVQHLNGLIKATSGNIYYNGEDIDSEGFDKKKLRSKVGLVFQYPEHQLFETDVFSDVCFGPKNLGLSQKESELRAYEALKLVGLEDDYFYQSPFELSGGQKRRVAIAGVLAISPDAIVLDEPTAMLDPIGRKEVMDTMQRLNREEGITVINITHFMEEAVLADRVVVMDHGRIVLSGTPKEVFTQVDFLKQMQLDVPPIAELAALLHKEDTHIAADIMTIEEMVRELCP